MSRLPEISPALAARLTTHLIDDAAVFPPGNTPIPTAVADHRAHHRQWYSDLVGPLLIPATRVKDFTESLGAGAIGSADPVRAVLIAGRDTHSAVDGLGLALLQQARNLLVDDDRVDVVGIEVALPEFEDMGALTRELLDQLSFGVPAAIEIAPTAGWERALDVLAEDGAERAKFRTGGSTPADTPTDSAVAAFLSACVSRSLPFKLTAGLHHAVRRGEADSPEHGFLNMLAATSALIDGASDREATAIVANPDVATLLEVLVRGDARESRRLFTSYGSCSMVEPLDDLCALGILRRPHEGG